MNISISNQPSFGMKFVNNQSFREVVNYAKETNQLRVLDTALNALNGANEGSIFLMHGKTPQGISFSNMNYGKRFLQNVCPPNANPVEASFEGIITISMLGKSFKKLIGGDVRSKLTAENIIKKFTVE